MRERETAESNCQQDGADAGKPVRGFGRRGPARQRRDDRRTRGRARRPPRRDDRGYDGQDHRGGNRPPLQMESVDPVPDQRLEARRERDPGGQAQRGSGRCAGDADNDSVGDHREANLAVGRAERAQHAQRPEPALRDDSEARGGNQTDEEETDRLECEDDHRNCGLARGRAGSLARRRARGSECIDRTSGGVEQDRHLGRWVGLSGRDECELVTQAQGVLDEPDDVARHTVQVHGVADVHVVGCGGIATSSRPRRRHSEILRRRCAASNGRTSRWDLAPRRSSVLTEPGIAMLWWSISSTAPKARRGGRDIGAVGAGKRDLVLRGSHHRVELLARVVCEPDSDGGRARPRTRSAPTPVLADATPDETAATTSGRSPAARGHRRSAPAPPRAVAPRAQGSRLGFRREQRLRAGRGHCLIHDAPVAQEHDPVGPRRELRVVGDHHSRDTALARGADEADHQLGIRGIECAGRLVREQQVSIPHHRACDRDALPLAAREIVRKARPRGR